MPKRHRLGVTATSVVAHIEDIVLATSGEDAFELVFGVAAVRVVTKGKASARSFERVARAHPELAVTLPRDANDALVPTINGSVTICVSSTVINVPVSPVSLIDTVTEYSDSSLYTGRVDVTV